MKETIRVKRLKKLVNNDLSKVVNIVRTSDFHYGERRNRDENYNYNIIGCDHIPGYNFYIWSVTKRM